MFEKNSKFFQAVSQDHKKINTQLDTALLEEPELDLDPISALSHEHPWKNTFTVASEMIADFDSFTSQKRQETKVSLLYQSAEVYYEQTDYLMTLTYLDEIFKIVPNHYPSRILLAAYFVESYKNLLCIDLCTQLLEEKSDPFVSKIRALAHYSLKNYEQAFSDAQVSLKDDPTDWELLDLVRDLKPKLIKKYLQQACDLMIRNYSEAREKINTILRIDPHNLEARQLLCRCLIDTREVDDALQICEQLLEEDPHNPVAQVLRNNAQEQLAALYYENAFRLFNEAKEAEALLQLAEILQLDANHYEARFLKGACLMNLGELQQAIEIWDALLNVDAEDTHVYKNRAFTYERLNQFEKAFNDAQTFLRLEPHDAQMLAKLNDYKARLLMDYYQEACTLFTAKNYQDTQLRINNILRLDPQHLNGRDLQACCYLETNQLQLAINLFTQLLNENPHYERALRYRAFSYEKSNQFEKAFNDAQAFLSLQPNDAQMLAKLKDYKNQLLFIYYQEAATLFVAKNFQGAQLKINDILRLDPQHLNGQDLQACCYLETNQLSLAINLFTQLLNENPHYERALMYRGISYEKSQNYSEALQDLNAYKNIRPNDSVIIALCESIKVKLSPPVAPIPVPTKLPLPAAKPTAQLLAAKPTTQQLPTPKPTPQLLVSKPTAALTMTPIPTSKPTAALTKAQLKEIKKLEYKKNMEERKKKRDAAWHAERTILPYTKLTPKQIRALPSEEHRKYLQIIAHNRHARALLAEDQKQRDKQKRKAEKYIGHGSENSSLNASTDLHWSSASGDRKGSHSSYGSVSSSGFFGGGNSYGGSISSSNNNCAPGDRSCSANRW